MCADVKRLLSLLNVFAIRLSSIFPSTEIDPLSNVRIESGEKTVTDIAESEGEAPHERDVLPGRIDDCGARFLLGSFLDITTRDYARIHRKEKNCSAKAH